MVGMLAVVVLSRVLLCFLVGWGWGWEGRGLEGRFGLGGRGWLEGVRGRAVVGL